MFSILDDEIRVLLAVDTFVCMGAILLMPIVLSGIFLIGFEKEEKLVI